ncbi:uncharacterized protein LOC122019229 [Zingiber officinale]|uniref:uncharacterized protein LOC122019229 n=1 Tax=Zingiber officinale TaxID=94328 RepID=UPI001C4CF1FD|nr:uncharacterized protein LOC122019229 [Zingiber officinale]
MTKKDEEFYMFLDKIKDIYAEVPLIDAIQQMPKFATFLKDIMSNRRKKGEIKTVALTEECSALFEKNTSPKLQDPGSFYIPCIIGPEFIEKACCDLGRSVSLISYPIGIIEDVPVEVGGYIIPIDFVVLDMEEDPKILIILGRPFLMTIGAIIDVKNHNLSLVIAKERLSIASMSYS